MTQRIPARILRAFADAQNGRPPPTEKELVRETLILNHARAILVQSGRPGLTMPSLALALRMSPASIKMAFCDLDNIVFEIISRHLAAIAAAIEAIPQTTANAPRARRNAYLKLARTNAGHLSENHIVLTRDRHALPPDLAEQVEARRLAIGQTLAGPRATIALNLLDTPCTDPADIHRMLESLQPISKYVAGIIVPPKPAPVFKAPSPAQAPPSEKAALLYSSTRASSGNMMGIPSRTG